ncbi:MAG TPA: hypothetical protein VHA75_13300 [Rugosimonospora sp.]|nr:hypothetical protein [Rugosimonospora sp.]
MAEPQYPPSSGAPYQPYPPQYSGPPAPTRQLPADGFTYAPASAPPQSAPPQQMPGALVPYSAQPAPVYAPPEQVIAQIGDIQVTSTTVRTPVGQFPLRGSQWQIVDAWTVSQRTPGWAIALAIIGFFCLTIFSLLFLLAKESVVTGMLQVQVSYGPQVYVTRIPVNNQAFVQNVYAQVNYVRALAAM